MASMTLSLDGAHLVIQIRQRTYTLTAPLQVVSTGGSLGLPKHLKFQYKDSFENAIDVGTLSELQADIYAMLTTQPAPPQASLQNFLNQWTQIHDALRTAPIVGSTIQSAENTDVRIVEIVLELTRTENDRFTGKLRLGLVFTPDPSHAPRLLNIVVRSFGAVVGVDLEGDVSDIGGWPA